MDKKDKFIHSGFGFHAVHYLDRSGSLGMRLTMVELLFPNTFCYANLTPGLRLVDFRISFPYLSRFRVLLLETCTFGVDQRIKELFIVFQQPCRVRQLPNSS